MSNFALSNTSLSRLDGVKAPLVEVVKRAIVVTTVDFGVNQGLRTIAQQKQYVASGASQTMQSKHLTGDAVDVMAYIDGHGRWDAGLYPTIADAFKQAAIDCGVKIRWGGAWNIADIRLWHSSMDDAMEAYAKHQRSIGARPFLDLGHFELN